MNYVKVIKSTEEINSIFSLYLKKLEMLVLRYKQ